MASEPASMDMDPEATLQVNRPDRFIELPQPHPLFFLEGNVVIRVHTKLYSIPKYLLKKSTLFETLFTLNPGPDGIPEGVSAENPLDLSKSDPSLTEQEFDRFISMLTCSIYTSPTWTIDDLDSILTLARKWEFQQVETYVLSRITEQKLTGIQMLSLGAKHNMSAVLLNGYVEACCRPAPLWASIDVMVSALGTAGFRDLCKARRATRRHIRALLLIRGDADCWSDCLNKPNHCHVLLGWKNAVRSILGVEEEDKEVDDEHKSFDDAFHAALTGTACEFCAPKEKARLDWFINMPELRKIVKDIMKA